MSGWPSPGLALLIPAALAASSPEGTGSQSDCTLALVLWTVSVEGVTIALRPS